MTIGIRTFDQMILSQRREPMMGNNDNSSDTNNRQEDAHKHGNKLHGLSKFCNALNSMKSKLVKFDLVLVNHDENIKRFNLFMK